MRGLADGFFSPTLGDYLAQAKLDRLETSHPAFRAVEQEVQERTRALLALQGSRSVDSFHREVGSLMWERCGMSRERAGLEEAIAKIQTLRERFWKEAYIGGRGEALNQSLERAGRVADFLEFSELMCEDALHREESCGGHFRVESVTPEGEAKRDDSRFSYVAAWEYTGMGNAPRLHKEPLTFEHVHLAQRSYT
jgi:succinate dehydrogenase / fumarate reductase flavoprotein subunit